MHGFCFPFLQLPAERALDYAVAQSYDATYGARPLRRWLEHAIITPLSRMIISGGCGGTRAVQVVDAVRWVFSMLAQHTAPHAPFWVAGCACWERRGWCMGEAGKARGCGIMASALPVICRPLPSRQHGRSPRKAAARPTSVILCLIKHVPCRLICRGSARRLQGHRGCTSRQPGAHLLGAAR